MNKDYDNIKIKTIYAESNLGETQHSALDCAVRLSLDMCCDVMIVFNDVEHHISYDKLFKSISTPEEEER